MTSWDSRLETGHPHIDEEHREVFRQLASLNEAIEKGAGRERVVELIGFLHKYAAGHFAREEAYMRRINCPAIADNQAAHRQFLGKLGNWLSLLMISGTPASVIRDVHRESIDWVTTHIADVDCRMRGCGLH
jgi:hemerythrin